MVVLVLLLQSRQRKASKNKQIKLTSDVAIVNNTTLIRDL